jgi:hypothetical protein
MGILRPSLLLAITLATASGQDLPKPAAPGDIDPDPKLILTDVPGAPALEAAPSALENPSSPPTPAAPMEVAKLEAAVERAKKDAASRERLWKAGILCKLEAEQGEMRVVRLSRDLANARLQAAQRAADELRKQPPANDPAKTALAEAESRLAAATTAAQDANTQWAQALRAAAELRVQRERKLVALGAEPRLALKEAEAALQKLIAPKDTH